MAADFCRIRPAASATVSRCGRSRKCTSSTIRRSRSDACSTIRSFIRRRRSRSWFSQPAWRTCCSAAIIRSTWAISTAWRASRRSTFRRRTARRSWAAMRLAFSDWRIADMLQREFAQTGLRVSAVGLGCNNFGIRLDAAATQKVVHAALDAGVTLFDTADIYGNRGDSERLLGEALGARRKDVVLVTKFGLPMDGSGRRQGGSRRYARQAIEASLKRLKTEWIDVYYFHRPDPDTPIEETLRALDDLVRQGKVRHIGCSNFSAAQLRQAQETARDKDLTPFVTA